MYSQPAVRYKERAKGGPPSAATIARPRPNHEIQIQIKIKTTSKYLKDDGG